MNTKKFLEVLQQNQKIPTSTIISSFDKKALEDISISYAKGILCQNKVPWGCGECYSCKIFPNHPDFMHIGLTQNPKIDDIREIFNFAYAKPNYSHHKVCLISNAQNMLREASNALLKVLEEPPLYFKFIINTDSIKSLIPTILSRSYVVELPTTQNIEESNLCNKLFSKGFYESVLEVDNIKDVEQKKELIDCLISKFEAFMIKNNTFDEEIDNLIKKLRFTKNALHRGIRLSLWLIDDMSKVIDKIFVL